MDGRRDLRWRANQLPVVVECSFPYSVLCHQIPPSSASKVLHRDARSKEQKTRLASRPKWISRLSTPFSGLSGPIHGVCCFFVSHLGKGSCLFLGWVTFLPIGLVFLTGERKKKKEKSVVMSITVDGLYLFFQVMSISSIAIRSLLSLFLLHQTGKYTATFLWVGLTDRTPPTYNRVGCLSLLVHPGKSMYGGW
ncbi:hypothetical protein BJX96DRAFT_155373 [Aspergillus floccosus]